MKRLGIWLFMLLFALPSFAAVTASVNRSTISEFEQLELTVSIRDVAIVRQPDFSEIARDFEILSQGESRQASLFGRQSAVVTTYTLALRPKRLGKLSIPPITVAGSRTRAIPINVVAPSAATQQRDARFVFFETRVDKQSAYVQSQIIYSLKLFFVDNIGGNFPDPPVIPEAVVEPVGGENRDVVMVNNQRFNVLEKRYAIFPQKSGQLTIPREVFRGTRGSNRFFAQRQQVAAISDPITINVKPRPAEFSGDTWIAAKSMNLMERWTDNPPQFKVGEPVNRIVSIHAVGLTGSLLPLVPDLDLDTVKTYADPPVTDERASGDGIVASSVTTVGIVPTKAGTITLPEIRIPWWNTATDKEEVAVMAEATYEVQPADGVEVLTPTVRVPLTQLTGQPQVVPKTSQLWIVLTVTLGLLCLFSLWQWWHVRRELNYLKRDEAEEKLPVFTPDEAHLFKELVNACKNNHAEDAHRGLFLWSHVRFNTESLQELRRALQRPDFDDVLDTLEGALYSKDANSEWTGERLHTLVKVLRNTKHEKVQVKDLVDELNPAESTKL